jgi:glycosyltransferase involved in cell wall biosynthesis
MRYVWYFGQEYFGHWRLRRLALSPALAYLKRWDVASAGSVTRWLAISRNVAARIERIYRARADVLYPPVNASFFTPGGEPGGYYLVVSALVPYKRLDIAVRAFNALGLPLKIVGEGPERKRLKALAGPGIEFLGWRTDEEVRVFYRGCRALIFPGEEDFGITPLEAMACGKPVIAYGKGGALETVRDGETGLCFGEQRPEALADAVRRAATIRFSPDAMRTNALRFDRPLFKERLKGYLEKAVAEFYRT